MSTGRRGFAGPVSLFCALAVVSGCFDEGTEPQEPVNLPPRILDQPDTSVAVGDTLRLRAVAHDPDGDLLKYKATVYMTAEEWEDGYRPRAGIDTLTGEFWFRGHDRDMPGRLFIFDVFDPHGGRDSTRFTIEVR